MALDKTNLRMGSVGASAAPNYWLYSTTDNIADVDDADYWGTSYPAMLAGDLVYCKCANGVVLINVTAINVTAGTSTAAAVGSGGNGGQVWVGPIACAGYGTAGKVGSFLAPIAGTMLSWRHITDTVVTANNVLNLDVASTNATGSITVALADTAADIIDSATITAGGTVTAGQLVTVESDGAGDTGAGRIWVLIQP